MHIFDYSFLANGMLPTSFVDLVGEIYSLKTKADMRESEYPKAFTELETLARIQSVRESNAIEGIVTTNERIVAIMNQSTAPRDHNEEEIAGYRDALALIHENHDMLDIKTSDILSLHHTMLSYTTSSDAGNFKRTDNLIIEVDEMGKRRVRFEPVLVSETPQAMEQLVLAYIDARSNSDINKLLLIPCVILDFLCIHPFNDGNGRISRLLSLLLLYKAGFTMCRYVSFEEQINVAKAAYYQALEQSSVGWHENKNDYSPFMKSFLVTLYRCYSELDKRFTLSNSRHVKKTERVEAMVLNSITPLSKSQICQMFPDISPTTVEAVLGSMVKNGTIKKIGSGRATHYIKNS
ncbi:MAG: Fic family protein [Coriobacteriales bacterium]|nr:Fic family protein [Coriobacteriales bacterium]